MLCDWHCPARLPTSESEVMMGWLIDIHVDDIASGQALLAQHWPDVHPRWRDLCARQHVSPYSATQELDSNQQKQVNNIFDIFACGIVHIP